MTDKHILTLIDKLSWTFAKTYASTSPHEYAVVKPDHPLRAEVVRFMKHIFQNGEKELYAGRTYHVYRIGGRNYWSMAKSEDTISDDNYILNRSV